MREISVFLSSCHFLVWNADHGFYENQLRNNSGTPSLNIDHRRPDAVFHIGQDKYAVEVQTRVLYHSDRFLSQLKAFSKAGYNIILVVPSTELQTARFALDLQNIDDIYAIVDLPGFKHLVLDLSPIDR